MHAFGFFRVFTLGNVRDGQCPIRGWDLYRESHSIKSSSIEFLIDTNETDRQLEEWGKDREQVLCIMEKEGGRI